MSAQPFKFVVSTNGVRLSYLLKLALLLAALCRVSSAQTPTTTSLSLTSGGSAITTASAGTMVTLTASVVAGSTAVNRGQVNFCDATAPHCTDTHLLGTAQLTSAGQATLRLRPGFGNYSYNAEFLGTPKSVIPYAASKSNAVSLTVTGPIPTATTIVQGGSSGNYTLSASVLGFTKSNAATMPTGTISFLDTTTTNSVLAIAPLAPSGPDPSWVNISNPTVGSAPGLIIAGDFNGDGNLDLAVGINSVIGGSPNTTVILLGDGQGNFDLVTSNPITATGSPVLVQDFNGDGIPDLLLSDLYGRTLTVLLGNGDGTFTQAEGSPIATNYGVFPVVSADFNGDGIPDLAVAGGYYLIVLLGNGDGTFKEVPITTSTISGADSFNSMVVADFNGDGSADLAAFSSFEAVAIYLGNGDGTFATGTSVQISSSASTSLTLATGDFNGDGIPDLAAPIYGSPSSIAILLGNGDGTFTPANGSPIPAGQWANRVAIGDFNGDGITDVFVGAATDTTDMFIFLGNGDGTFVPASTGSIQLPCCSESVFADFNGDGVTDLVSTDFYNGVADVLLTAMQQSSSSSAAAISVNGPTPQQVVASYSGDSTHSPSQSAPTSLLVQAAAPVFAPAPGSLSAWQEITLTTATPDAIISYQASGSALQTNGYVRYTGPIVVSSLGSVTIQAFASEYNYGQSQTSSATYTVSAPNPVPVLNSLSPAYSVGGIPPANITITGSGFTPLSGVYWSNIAIPAQFVSATQIIAQPVLFDILNSGASTANITVQTPSPGGGISNGLEFELDTGGPGTSPVFSTSNASVAPGSSASYRVTLPSFASNVSVSCLNLPVGAACSYSNNPSVLKISTTPATPAGSYQITAVFNETVPVSTTALVLSPFLLLPLAGFRARRKRKLALALAFFAVVLPLCALSGCGGGSAAGSGGSSTPTQQVTSSGVVILTVQ